MTKTLVWVEHEGGAVKDATLSAVTAAAKLGEVHLLVAGDHTAIKFFTIQVLETVRRRWCWRRC